MPGGLPTGSNPGYITPHPFSMVGGGFSDLNTRTEANVRPILESEVRSDPGISGLSNDVFSGLNPILGLPAAIIKAALQAIAGVPLSIVGGGLEAILSAFTGGIPASQIQDHATENIVFNPQFNVDLAGWTSSNTGGGSPVDHFVQDGTEGHSSQGSAKVVASSLVKTLRSTRIPVLEDNEITVSAWRKLDSGAGVASPIRVNVRYFNAAGSFLASTNVGATSGTGTSDWTEITTAPITIDATAKFIEVELEITGNMSTGTVWFDDVSVKKAGKIPQDMITGLVEAISTTVQMLIDTFFGIPGMAVDAFTGFLQLLGGLFPALESHGDGTATETPLAQHTNNNDGTAVITGGLGSLLQVVDGVVTTLGSALTGFLGMFGVQQGTLNAVTTGLTGSGGVNNTVNDVQLATQQAANVLADNSAAILGLQQAGSGSGSVASLNFTSMANANFLADFNQYYAGPNTGSILGIRDARAAWNVSDTPFPDQWRSCLAVYTLAATTGDDQLIGAAYSTLPMDRTNDWIAGRANLAGDTFVLADFTAGRLELSCTVSGVKTVFTSIPYSKKASAAYYLQCGPGRTFKVYENTSTILTYTEPGTTSAMGASFRRAGFGGISNTVVFWWMPFEVIPGHVTAWSLADV